MPVLILLQHSKFNQPEECEEAAHFLRATNTLASKLTGLPHRIVGILEPLSGSSTFSERASFRLTGECSAISDRLAMRNAFHRPVAFNRTSPRDSRSFLSVRSGERQQEHRKSCAPKRVSGERASCLSIHRSSSDCSLLMMAI